MTTNSDSHIIHITKEYSVLERILSSKSFILSFSKENFYYGGKVISQAIHPMVCFSEYCSEEIDSKIITYGKYGVGFDKEWARKKKIGPVLYISQTSLAAKGMASLLKARRNQNLPNNLRLPIMELKCFIKNEIGFNGHTKDREFDFKAENEWRYVPKKAEIDNYYISQNQSIYKNNKEILNKISLKYPLKFKLEDIKVVFVLNQTELNLIHEKFKIDKNIIKIAGWRES